MLSRTGRGREGAPRIGKMPEDTSAPSDVLAPVLPPAAEGAKAVFRAPRGMVWFMRFAAVFFLLGWCGCLSFAAWDTGRDAIVLPIAGSVTFAPMALLAYRLTRRMQDEVHVDGSAVAYVRFPRGGWMVRWGEVTELRETFGCLELITGDRDGKPMLIQWSNLADRGHLAIAVYSCFHAAHGRAPATTVLPVSFRLRFVTFAVVAGFLLAFGGGYGVGGDGGGYGWLGIAAGWWLLALVIWQLMILPVSVTVDQDGLVLDRLAKRYRYGFERIGGVGLDNKEASVFVLGRHQTGKWVSLGLAKEGTLLMYYTLFSAWQAWKQANANHAEGE